MRKRNILFLCVECGALPGDDKGAAMSSVPVRVKCLDHFEDLSLPRYESLQAAGMDVQAAVAEDVILQPGERTLVPTGLCMALATGWEVQVRPRSGLAIKKGITCLNSPGTIDADYRGEVQVILANMGQEPFTIERGMRIAQLVLAPVWQAEWLVVDELDETERGFSGFGSTGVGGNG
jgi:dUTP pyrophosphatase